MRNYWFKVLLILLHILPIVGYTQGNISASTTPATCAGDGTLTIAIPNGTINSSIIYFIYNSTGFYLESKSPVFTDLDSGDYFYGYVTDDFAIYEESTDAINVGSVCTGVQISAVSTSARCPGTGEITVSVTNLDGPILYGVAKSPYSEANVIVSTNSVITNLDIGDYYYGYFDGSTFVKANKTINVAREYSTDSPTITKVTAQNFTYCSEGSDPLGEILVECNGGNSAYTIILTKASDGSEVKRASASSWYRFTDVSPGNYKVKVTDRCGITVFYPLEVSLSANVSLTDFVFKKRNAVQADIVYNTPGNVCSGISSATIKMYYLAEAVSMSGMTPPFYKEILGSEAFTCSYKLEIQNGNGWEVYDNLKMTIDGDYDRNFSLPVDRSKWGLVRLTATTCGMSKIITQDYGASGLAKPLSFDVASFKFSNDPANTNCSRTGKIKLNIGVNINMGCAPYTLEVIDTETNDKATYTSTADVDVAQNNLSCLLQIGKTYSFKLKDSSGAEPAKSYFTYYNDSGSGLTLGSNLKSLFIDPTIFGAATQKDKAKIIFYTGPSGTYFRKSILVASYPVKKSNSDVGLEGEVTISLESGPSVLEISKGSVVTSGLNSNDSFRLMNLGFLGLGNNLAQGTYKIRVKDSGCFDEVFEVVLDSYFTGIKITDVSYTPEANVCDRYIKKVTTKVDFVGNGVVPKDLEYLRFVDSGYVPVGYIASVYAQTLTGPVAGGTTGNSNVFLKGGTLDLVYKDGELPGNYEIGLSREYFNYGFLKSDKLWENTTTASLSVKPNSIVFDLSQSGGIVCAGNTTGDLYVKVKNVGDTEIVMYFVRKDTDKAFPASGQTSPVFKGLEAGNYVVRAQTTCYEVDQPLILRSKSDPLIKGKNSYCKGDSVKLDIGQVGPVTSIKWTLPDGTTSNAAQLALDNVTTAQSGSYKLEINTIGGCYFTESVTIAINDPKTPTTTKTTQKFCKTDNKTVADLAVNESGVTWYDAATGGNTVASTTTLEDNKVYYGSLKTNTCESPIRLAVKALVKGCTVEPPQNWNATACVFDEATYKVASGMSDYNWIVSKEGVIVAGGESTDDYVTVVWNSAGKATVKADYIDASKFDPLISADFSVVVNSCSDVGLKKTVDNPTPGIGHQVVFTITAENLGTNVAKEVVISEKLPSGYDYVTSQASSGSYNSIDGIWTLPVLQVHENQTLKITARVKEFGDYLNIAYLKNSNPVDINEMNNKAEVSVVIEDVIVYNAISINGDGLNDYFKITGLHNYPNNTVEIFNRNGVQIFKTHNYGGNNNVFRGISEGRATISKKSGVPTGTYFYILRYERAGVFRERVGYLYVSNN